MTASLAASLLRIRVAILAAAGVGSPACKLMPLEPAGGSSGIGGEKSTSSATMANSNSGASTSGTSGTAAPPVDSACGGAMPLTFQGMPDGFALCPDRTVHRVSAVACEPTITAGECAGTEQMLGCTRDSDCTAAPRGKCITNANLGPAGVTTFCGCVYSCASDTECGTNKACVCFAGGDVFNHAWAECIVADCKTGADCASGECGLGAVPSGCMGTYALGCRTSNDQCRTDFDCQNMNQNAGCTYSSDASGTPVWHCLPSMCPTGRPYLIDGNAIAAAPTKRGDWSAEIALVATQCDTRETPALAAHWLEIAAMEHASVASFARFTLELLALGAPAELVHGAQQAALDEIEHARIAYGLASAYAGRPLGPGPLPLSGGAAKADRASVMQALLEEGCVGETLGVIEALVAEEAATDPMLREVHARIAADEQRHAELAWRTLAWLLGDSTEAERAIASDCFERAIARASLPGQRAGVREVLVPCRNALFSQFGM